MKKSFIYRTLQVASAVTAYSIISIWASTKHVDIVSNILTQIDSLLVILAIAVALPYFCFKVLGKLYTPPKSRNVDQSSQSGTSTSSQDGLNEDIQEDSEVMQYRGNRYNPEDLTTSINNDKTVESQPVIKYRGVSVANGVDSSSTSEESFSTPRDPQKSAKPKERIKYRGSYVD